MLWSIIEADKRNSVLACKYWNSSLVRNQQQWKMADKSKKHTIYKNSTVSICQFFTTGRLTSYQGGSQIRLGSALIPPSTQQPQTYTLSRSQRNTARVSIDSTWHAAATDLQPVKESEKYSQSQHWFHLVCSSHRLTFCQKIWPGLVIEHHIQSDALSRWCFSRNHNSFKNVVESPQNLETTCRAPVVLPVGKNQKIEMLLPHIVA